MQILVVHLAWADAGSSSLEQFLSSYTEHPAGIRHHLVIAWNGYQGARELASAQSIAADVDHEDFEVTTRERDLTVYRLVADRYRAAALCFLNSYSVILHKGWLDALAGHLADDGVGVVGATGSYESPLSGARLPLKLLRARRYPRFPNPHLRTNAFMLGRELMLSLHWPQLATKRAAWELESGNRGITRQIEARGLKALVVGRDGQGYPPDRWRESRTFRAGEQENLLIADNRTQQYAEADPRLRRKLSSLAWGASATGPWEADAK